MDIKKLNVNGIDVEIADSEFENIISNSEKQEMIITSDDENEIYLKINQNGIYTNNYYDVDGFPIITKNEISLSGKTIVCFGDSITEFYDNNTPRKRYSDYLMDMSGANVINVGIGGTQFKQRQDLQNPISTNWGGYAYLDIVNIIKAVCEQDFEMQVVAAEYLKNNAGDNNVDIIKRLKEINFNNVDIITIFAGTNDWNDSGGVFGDDINNIKNTYGAINDIIIRFMSTYPHIKIYWFTPTIRWILTNGQKYDQNYSDVYYGEKNLRNFSKQIMNMIKGYNIPIKNMYEELGWNRYNMWNYFPDNDGTHPQKGEGMKKIAEAMYKFIISN